MAHKAPEGITAPKGFEFDVQQWLNHSRTNRQALQKAIKEGDKPNETMFLGMLESSYRWVWECQIRDFEADQRRNARFKGFTVQDLVGFLRTAVQEGDTRFAIGPLQEARELAFVLKDDTTARRIEAIIRSQPAWHRNIPAFKHASEVWFKGIDRLADELTPKATPDDEWCQDFSSEPSLLPARGRGVRMGTVTMGAY